MRVGIDIHFCRATQTGIYTYLWNIINWMRRLESPPDITLFLIGQPLIEEPEQVGRMKAAFSDLKVEYFWDDVPLQLLSYRVWNNGTNAPWLVREIDRRILLRVWRKLIVSDSRLVQRIAQFARPRHDLLSRKVDLLHHPVGLVLPLHAKTNVMTINDLIPHHFPHYYPREASWFRESFERVHQMDIIMTYSEHTKQDVVESLGMEPDRIHVIPLAAHQQYRPIDDKDQLQSVLRRYDLQSTPYIVHLGALEPRKNISRLVEAFYLLLREDPSLEHQLILVGPRFGLYEPIFETIEHLHLKDRVRWLGQVPFEDLPALLNGADLFIYPSIYEGFGLPPLEAMACGTPVITSSHSSLPEIVGDAGLLVDPYQVKEMAETMHRVLTNSDLRGIMSRKGIERSNEFTWEKTARLTLDAYKEAIDRSLEKTGRTTSRKERDRAQTEGYKTAHDWFVDQAFDQTIKKLRL